MFPKKAFFWALNDQVVDSGRRRMVKSTLFIPILVLSCLSVALLTAVAKAFWVIVQVNILNLYHTATWLGHINLVAIILSLLLAGVLPNLMTKVKPRYLLGMSLVLSAFLVMAFPFLDATFWGYVLTVGVIVTNNVSQIIGLTILNQILEDHYRTTFQGIYNTVYYLSFGLGPLLVAVCGNSHKFALYIYLALALVVTSIALFTVHSNLVFKEITPEKRNDSRLKKLLGGVNTLKEFPALLLMAIITCLNIGSTSNLLVFWGESYHLSVETSQELPAIFCMGASFLAIPLGYIADKVGTIRMFMIINSIIIACYVYLSLDNLFETFDFVALFILGGCVAAMTSISVSYIGNLFSHNALAKATAGFSFLRLLGNVFGIYFASELIHDFKAYGFNEIMGILNIILMVFLYVFLQKSKDLPPAPVQQTD